MIENNDLYLNQPFSFQNKLIRFIWNIVYVLLFKPSPRLFFEWRSFLLREQGQVLYCNIFDDKTALRFVSKNWFDPIIF